MKKAVLALVVISAIVSCKKDKTETPQQTVAGFWVGKWSNSSTPNNKKDWTALFRSNGTVRLFSTTDTLNADKAEGTYQLTANKNAIEVTYYYLSYPATTYTLSAGITNGMSVMNGTWKLNNFVSSGDFYFNKQ